MVHFGKTNQSVSPVLGEVHHNGSRSSRDLDLNANTVKDKSLNRLPKETSSTAYKRLHGFMALREKWSVVAKQEYLFGSIDKVGASVDIHHSCCQCPVPLTPWPWILR